MASDFSAGHFADHFFEPAMSDVNGSLASTTLGVVYGIGQGRGIAVMMSICGLLTFMAVLMAFFKRSIRRVDLDLPDCEVQHEPIVSVRKRKAVSGTKVGSVSFS